MQPYHSYQATPPLDDWCADLTEQCSPSQRDQMVGTADTLYEDMAIDTRWVFRLGVIQSIFEEQSAFVEWGGARQAASKLEGGCEVRGKGAPLEFEEVVLPRDDSGGSSADGWRGCAARHAFRPCLSLWAC